MDWTALWLSLRLGAFTVVLLLPVGIFVGRRLAYSDFAAKGLVEALVALPLVLPPTVLGFYLLTVFGATSPIGGMWEALAGKPLVFSFEGLLIASLIVNLPFAILPMQRGFEAIPREVREAAACCGMSPWRVLGRIELPLAWPGVLTASVLSFAHTLGEFGVVLMVGGNIPGETETISIAIYDRVQAFDNAAAAGMSALLLGISVVTITLTFVLSRRIGRRLG
ncbi:MAG: molybdate ABC transporter permease subunit [Gammaproteobacteria bacterium]|nr:molybdate ABC transporter permease subunit [Gammaproteobacteria bacterium]NIM73250.1 molybdate ABC transporter permease subunit [Gammaproteobacteria bacterium]NIO24951.1 molybdate ABC transporter permease subunit [Gammaproteobacteria bacterium]NIO65553.1 molybdate ABC transporter permease subunit [Gammaproteobacteria bacterium]NIP45380.1 molybdate ABC transporter permease subunit [Gammaproteobacteria bacterium]